MANEHNSHNKRPIQYYASTLVLVAVLVALEIAILAAHILWVSRTLSIVNLGLRLLSLIVMLHIVNKEESIAYKLAWCIPILLIPLVGGIAYLIGCTRNYQKVAKRRIKEIDKTVTMAMAPTENISPEDMFTSKADLCQYLEKKGFQRYDQNKIRYFSMGEQMFTELLTDLGNAKHFIFMEYFIIQEGVMWNSILSILKEKAAKGVDVRILYDGMGCIRTLPRNYNEKLAEYGIKSKVFSPFMPVLSTLQNNRDHRKITVIDGKIAYTGGINLADEYINEIERYGVWKDSAVKIEGSATDSFTRYFLTQWYIKDPNMERDLSALFGISEHLNTNEAVIPYAISPLDDSVNGKDVYLKIINGAKDYLYIMTPYFVPGEEIMNALKMAAESGVDVRLITPHLSDNKAVHTVTRSKYQTLLQAGVRIYEYTPGFIHSKNTVCDDVITTCGSVNMDYRSLYLHFECGSVIYGRDTAEAVKTDFLDTLKVCMEITKEETTKQSVWQKIYLCLIRTFEPLL